MRIGLRPPPPTTPTIDVRVWIVEVDAAVVDVLVIVKV